MRQLPLPVQLRASSVFASFYRGPNTVLVEQLKALQPNSTRPSTYHPSTCHRSTWLYGPSGVGKTHLLQAVCAQAGENKWSAAYFPLADSAFTPEVLMGCESLGYVCLDNFEYVAGQTAWEHAVFRLYTELEDSGGQLLIAANAPPASVNIALKDLASRLAIGALLRIEPLSDDEQSAALKLRAEQLGLELSADTVQFILRRLPRDMTALCDVLDTLDRASLATQRRLTIPFVRAVLETRQSG